MPAPFTPQSVGVLLETITVSFSHCDSDVHCILNAILSCQEEEWRFLRGVHHPIQVTPWCIARGMFIRMEQWCVTAHNGHLSNRLMKSLHCHTKAQNETQWHTMTILEPRWCVACARSLFGGTFFAQWMVDVVTIKCGKHAMKSSLSVV